MINILRGVKAKILSALLFMGILRYENEKSTHVSWQSEMTVDKLYISKMQFDTKEVMTEFTDNCKTTTKLFGKTIEVEHHTHKKVELHLKAYLSMILINYRGTEFNLSSSSGKNCFFILEEAQTCPTDPKENVVSYLNTRQIVVDFNKYVYTSKLLVSPDVYVKPSNSSEPSIVSQLKSSGQVALMKHRLMRALESKYEEIRTDILKGV